MSERVGIFGGTFNPVHTGHLIAARDVFEQLRLDVLKLVPCALPPHKSAPALAPANHRLAMLRAAVRGQNGFEVDDIEIRRGPPSYSVDTLRELRCRYPRAQFFFVIGSDSLPELTLWRESAALFQFCTFAVVTRPGYEPAKLPAGARCRFVRGHACEISSSDIRSRLARGADVRWLVPDAVFRYIRRVKPYQTTKEKRPSKPVS